LRAAEGGGGRGDGAREVAGAVEHVGWWRHGRPIGQSLAADLRPPWRGGQRLPDGPPHAAAQAPRPGTRSGTEEEAALEAARGAKAVLGAAAEGAAAAAAAAGVVHRGDEEEEGEEDEEEAAGLAAVAGATYAAEAAEAAAHVLGLAAAASQEPKP
jgi:hypothetical protein